jgi:hypothetical protein
MTEIEKIIEYKKIKDAPKGKNSCCGQTKFRCNGDFTASEVKGQCPICGKWWKFTRKKVS